MDKANSVLVRFQEQQAESSTGYKDYSRYKRPKNVSKIKSIKEANEWKRQVSKEIQQKSTRIYDPSLNEIQITELNDELNDPIHLPTWDVGTRSRRVMHKIRSL